MRDESRVIKISGVESAITGSFYVKHKMRILKLTPHVMDDIRM